MKTLGELGLRNFITDDSGSITEVTTKDCAISTKIDLNTYLLSKSPNPGNSRMVPYSPTQILEDIDMYSGSDRWSDFYVYRDHVRYDGYVNRSGRNNRLPLVTPDLPLSDVVFERVIGVLDLISTDNYKFQMAIKFEPGKLQMSFGTNVRVCNNFTIFGNNLMSVGDFKSYDAMLDTIISKFSLSEKSFAEDQRLIESMINVELSMDDVNRAMGDLLYRYNGDKPVLNMTDISDASKLIWQRNEKGELKNAWDFLNCCNENLKFDRDAGNNTLERIHAIANYVPEVFELN